MSTDIERLLAEAADDVDQPPHTDVDAILVRARRSVRRTRIATVSTAVLTTAAIIGGVATWSSTRPESVGPAGTPKGQTVTMDVRTGRLIDNETGKTVVPAPPASPLSDAEVLQWCKQYDHENVQFLQEHRANAWDKAGPIDARWKVVLKSGDKSLLTAMFLDPDQSIVSICVMDGPQKPHTNGRLSTTVVMPRSTRNLPQAVDQGSRIPVPGVTRVLVDLAGETNPHEALVGTDGFFTLGYSGRQTRTTVDRIRGYDASGKQVYEQDMKPPAPPKPTQPTVGPEVTVKTVAPIAPKVVLTKDPETGRRLAPPPPVSPLTDEQITTRCRGVDDIYFKDLDKGSSNPNTAVIKAAGPVTKDWQVALKTGTGDKLTAVLVSPDKRVYAWCHLLTDSAKGAYDYSRGAVQANGKFADGLEFAMVPDGVAQIVVDLPTQGPTRALISNGYYIWGLTGGNSNLQNVRVRGFDAQGKKIYDAKKDVDTDFD